MSAANRRARGGRVRGAPRADDVAEIPPEGRPDEHGKTGTLRIDAGAAGAIVSVRVQPRARRSALAGIHSGALKVALRAPPVDGAANAALVELLAGLCAVAPSSVQIVGGQTSRQKRVLFTTLDAAALGERLGQLLEV